MKRIYLLILTVATFTACQNKTTSPGENVKAITIKYTELGRQTLYRINCDNFEKDFPKLMSMTVASKPAMDSLMAVLSNMKRMDDEQPDVRAKIFITNKDNKTDTVCVGITSLKYQHNTYETPQKLLMMIQQ